MLPFHLSSVLFRGGQRILVMFITSLTCIQTTQSGTPDGLSVHTGDRKIDLTWSDVDGAVTWNVKRSLNDAGSYSLVTNVATSAFTDTSVSNGIPYYYVVSELSETGESSDSLQVVGVPSGEIPAPFQTQDFLTNGLAGGAGYTEGTYFLSGSAAQRSVFEIVSGGWVSARVVSLQSQDSSAEAGLALKVGTAERAIGVSLTFAVPDSIQFRIRDSFHREGRASVTGIALPVVLRLRRIGDRIYAGYDRTGNGFFAELPGGAVVPLGTNYCVRGIVTRTSSASRLATATIDRLEPSTHGVVPAPSGLTAHTTSAQIKLTWASALGATNYNIKRSVVSGASYSIIGHTDQPTFTDQTVKKGIAYYYVVSALCGRGESNDSEEVSAITIAPPTLVANLSNGADRITISWPDTGEGLLLYQAVGLHPQSEWTPVLPAAVSSNGMFSLDFITVNNFETYFRLQKP